MHFAKKTIRQCHAMSYKQIMGHKYCRMMIKQDVEAKQHSKARHTSTHHKKTRHHKASHKRR
jgi:hypothetical protein